MSSAASEKEKKSAKRSLFYSLLDRQLLGSYSSLTVKTSEAVLQSKIKGELYTHT